LILTQRILLSDNEDDQEKKIDEIIKKLNDLEKEVKRRKAESSVESEKEEREKKAQKRVKSIRDAIMVGSASLLGAVTTKLMDVYWTMPNLTSRLIAALIIVLEVFLFAFLFAYPIDELIIRWEEKRRKKSE
jgi:cation transport ATPase